MKHLYIASEWINSLVRSFTNIGLDIKALTHQLSGFEDGQLLTGQRIEVSTARTLWHRAVDISDDPLLGLTIGLSQDYRAIGVLAPIIWHSPTLRTAFNNIGRFQKLISENGTYKITQASGTPNQILQNTISKNHLVNAEYIPVQNIVPISPHQVLSVVAGTITMMSALSNRKETATRLSVPPSLDAKLISATLGCEVVTNESNIIIEFSTEFFDEPLLGCDEHVYQLNKAYAEELLEQKHVGIALIDTVKKLIFHHGFNMANIEVIEQELGLHKRTLQRHLVEQGTSFRHLKEEVLKDQAAKHLMQKKLDIETIARHLGYSEPSAFHRAFKVWFGVTPKQFSK